MDRTAASGGSASGVASNDDASGKESSGTSMLSRTAGKECSSGGKRGKGETGDGVEHEEKGGSTEIVAISARDGEKRLQHVGISAGLQCGIAWMRER